jgi:hypothetical protein
MGKFGGIFERYVEKALSYSGVSFLNEDKLRLHLSDTSKLVDFLIVDQDANIFIDAKGVEMGYLGMVSHRPDVIRDKTKSSIIKGIIQGYETAKRISDMDYVGELKRGNKENYLIIVTFKDLYIGNGQDFYQSVAKQKLDEIISEYEGRQWIPLENMYFLSIDDLDLFVEGINMGKISMAEGLRGAVIADMRPESKKFVFRQHVFELCPTSSIPQYLEDEFERIMHSFKQKIIEGR